MTLVSIGTTTVPFGCTKGWPPIPTARLAVGVAAPQREPSVRGSTHQNLIGIQRIVPLHITIAVMRTAGPTVADHPIFVGALRNLVDADGVLPCESIGGSVHHHGSGLGSGDRQRSDHPHAVPRVIGYGGIAGGVVRPRPFPCGQAWQKSMTPGCTSVGRSRPSDGSRSPGGDSSCLKRRHQRRAVRQHMRLDLSRMLPRQDCIWIGTNQRQVCPNWILRRCDRRRRGGRT